jgi:Flp pilus assembly protein TadG
MIGAALRAPGRYRLAAIGATLRTRLAAACRDERGDATIVWCLGIALLFLPIGGIAVDGWHVISEERALQAAASAAADAAASGIDVTAYRESGQVVLDPAQATSLADADLADQTGLPTLSSPPEVTVSPNGDAVTVELKANIGLLLLGILNHEAAIHVIATGSAAPRASGAP